MSTATTADLETTLSELIRHRPALAGVFDRIGLDFCCHGDRSLAEACRISGVEAEAALAAIDAEGAAGGPGPDWAALGVEELADHIEAEHHGWLHADMPELQRLAAKVASVHGQRHPELGKVRDLLDEVAAAFLPHLDREEQSLFPAIRLMARGGCGPSSGPVAGPIAQMVREHETVGRLLEELREVSSGYAVPEDGCASYRLLYERLEALEADTHLHVFKENSILFPAALELQAGSSAG